MKKNMKTLLALTFSAVMTGLLVKTASASGNAVSSGATVKYRVNNAVSLGAPLTEASKGVKQYEVRGGNHALIVDESSSTVTSGLLVGVQLSTGPSDNSCYLLVADSATASGLTLATDGRLIVPPLVAGTSASLNVEYLYPKQFNRGLYVVMSTPSSGSTANCRATISWKRTGGAE